MAPRVLHNSPFWTPKSKHFLERDWLLPHTSLMILIIRCKFVKREHLFTYSLNKTKLLKSGKDWQKTPYIGYQMRPQSHGKHILLFDEAVKLKRPYLTQSVVFIMRPSSLGGGRILRRTLSVRLSVCPSVCPSVPLADVLCLQLHRLTSEHPK